VRYYPHNKSSKITEKGELGKNIIAPESRSEADFYGGAVGGVSREGAELARQPGTEGGRRLLQPEERNHIIEPWHEIVPAGEVRYVPSPRNTRRNPQNKYKRTSCGSLNGICCINNSATLW